MVKQELYAIWLEIQQFLLNVARYYRA